MKFYCIFDDFGEESVQQLQSSGIHIDVHPHGVPRPNPKQMKIILESYDGVIIGTSQKITEDMFENIDSPRIIATASVGLDHIRVPKDKKHLVTIFNTPLANAQSVAEYTLACALTCSKRLGEGKELYLQGKDNKRLHQKPEDLNGKTIGVVGAGNISVRIMDYARFMGMNILCWSAHPEKHQNLDVKFVSLSDLLANSDIISVNLPNNTDTQNLISEEAVSVMKDTCIFISVSRMQTIDYEALFKKAENNPGFYVCLDLDINEDVIGLMPNIQNVLVTPHIAGGTIETRKRMFKEVTAAIINKKA